MSKAQYKLTCHEQAQGELEGLEETDKNALTETLKEIATYREPSNHEKVKLMRNLDGLFRVRQGDVRAFCYLEQPELRVVMVGYRDKFYNKKHEAQQRMQ